MNYNSNYTFLYANTMPANCKRNDPQSLCWFSHPIPHFIPVYSNLFPIGLGNLYLPNQEIQIHRWEWEGDRGVGGELSKQVSINWATLF